MSAPVSWEALYLLAGLIVAVVGATAIIVWLVAVRMLRVVERMHALEMRIARLEDRAPG